MFVMWSLTITTTIADIDSGYSALSAGRAWRDRRDAQLANQVRLSATPSATGAAERRRPECFAAHQCTQTGAVLNCRLSREVNHLRQPSAAVADAAFDLMDQNRDGVVDRSLMDSVALDVLLA